MRKQLVFPVAAALVALLVAAGQYAYAHRSDKIVYVHPRQARYVDGWPRQALGCLVGKPESGDIVAPAELGLPAEVSYVPPDLVGKCYAFSVGFDPCTGSIQYADALTEFGPQPCP